MFLFRPFLYNLSIRLCHVKSTPLFRYLYFAKLRGRMTTTTTLFMMALGRGPGSV